MSVQVVVIGGGEAFDTREEYLAYLSNAPYDPYEVRPDGWKKNLPIALGDGYEVIVPSMPCPVNAKYDEWAIWFGRVIPFLRDGVVFVGHSLGANFLVKYLVGNALPVKTGGLHLVAGCFGYAGGFDLPGPIGGVSERTGKIFIYHSHDDPLVPFADSERYLEALPSAELITFDDRGHFFQADFPELVERIQD